jgi:hypothetical protein
VVGVNSDQSAHRLHGVLPSAAEDDRAAVVAALGSVDHALVFDSETAVPLIEALAPDVYVKGGDYLPGMLAEAGAVSAVGGRLETLGWTERPHRRPVDERRTDSHPEESGPMDSHPEAGGAMGSRPVDRRADR